MSAIGILGGMGPQASAHLLNLLVRDAPNHTLIKSDTDFPEIVVLSVPVPNFISNKKHFEEAKQILIKRVGLLEQADCSVVGIACNTAHLLLLDLQAITAIPFVSIPLLVAKEIKRAGFRRVGLLASPNTLDSTLFDEAIGKDAELIRPPCSIAKQIEKLIFKQLRGSITQADKNKLHRITNDFMSSGNLDTIILGCTELPIIFGESKDPRIIETLEILSKALLEKFFSGQNPNVL